MFSRNYVIFFVVLSLSSHAQNLIPNESFENYAQCPERRNGSRFADSWKLPTKGTSDYFNTCARGTELYVPDNFAGTQLPRTGNAYAGFYAGGGPSSLPEYREYLQVTLDSFLVKGRTYRFEMYISLSDKSNQAVNKIGAYISTTKISSSSTTALNYTPHIIASDYVTDKTGWTKISGFYMANGGEHYITIGVFETDANITAIDVNGGDNGWIFDEGAYYYIDDASYVQVFCDLPKVLLPNDISVCAENFVPINVKSVTTNANSFLWNTGATTSYITISTPGKYILKETSQYCTAYDTINIAYTPKPIINLGNDTTVCNNYIKLKTSPSGGDYLWSTGSTNSEIYVVNTGKYWVKLGSSICYSFDTINVEIIRINAFSLGPDTTVCAGTEVELIINNNPLASFKWSTGETSSAIYANTTGTYWAEAYKGLCRVKDSIKITIEQPPVINIGNDTSLCFNQPFTINASAAPNYLWNNGSVLNAITVSKEGMYWVEVIGNKCVARDSISIMQKEIPVVNIGDNKSICKEVEFTLDAENVGSAYSWNTNKTAQKVVVKAPGEFSVTVTNLEGCYATDRIILDTFISPTVSLGNDSFVCEGIMYKLDAGEFASYLWQNGSTKRTFELQTAGSYFVIVKDEHLCSAIDSIKMLYYQKPDVTLLQHLRICEPDTIITAISSTNNYLWNDGSSSASNRITGYGKFTVIVTDTHFCTNTADLEVVSTCNGAIYVPNVFTPSNRDGTNDAFFPVLRNVTQMHMFIYNRWGELVFETEDAKKGWNGTFRNEPVQADVYVYRINYTGLSGAKGSLAGNVTVLK
jgi:gliding motility-associated-like protein